MNSSLHEQLRCALQKNKIPENLGFFRFTNYSNKLVIADFQDMQYQGLWHRTNYIIHRHKNLRGLEQGCNNDVQINTTYVFIFFS
jgi:hypothetical protein